MSDERVREALRTLAESDSGREAPAEVEVRLREAFAIERGRLGRAAMWRRAGLWTAAAAAAIVAVVIFTQGRFSKEGPRSSPPPVTAVVRPVPRQPVPGVTEQPPAASKPARRTRRARPEPQPREVVTDFFPLMDVAPTFERGALIRVSVPAASMRSVGFPVSEDHLADPIHADVLVGEEGLARAIRFVKLEQ